jgi:hypothetical protein
MKYLCHNDHRYVPFVGSTSWSFPYSRVIIGFVTRLTRRVPIVELDLHALLEHLNSPQSLGQPQHFGSDDFNFTKRNSCFSSFLVNSILYQGHPDRSHQLWNIVSSDRYILHMPVLSLK